MCFFFTGHQPYGAEVHSYTHLKSGIACKLTKPPSCTDIDISTIEWGFHGNHTYYVTIKAENVAGLTTYGVSEPYVHNVQLPAEGIVMDTSVCLISNHFETCSLIISENLRTQKPIGRTILDIIQK